MGVSLLSGIAGPERNPAMRANTELVVDTMESALPGTDGSREV